MNFAQTQPGDTIRGQQDALLEAMRVQLSTKVAPEGADEVAPINFGAPFMAPMIAAAKAYEDVGDAVLAAQRNALSSFTAETTH